MNEIRIFVTFNIIQLCFRNSNQYNYPPKTNEEEREITISKFYDWLLKKIGQRNEDTYKN